MKIEKHYERLRESLEVIDESITKGIIGRQRTIGFSCSAAASDMMEIFLHQNDLIDSGFVVKHEWFASKNKLAEKFPFDFQRKDAIIGLMSEIESRRNALCYGIPKEENEIKIVLEKFNELTHLFKKEGVEIEK